MCVCDFMYVCISISAGTCHSYWQNMHAHTCARYEYRRLIITKRLTHRACQLLFFLVFFFLLFFHFLDIIRSDKNSIVHSLACALTCSLDKTVDVVAFQHFKWISFKAPTVIITTHVETNCPIWVDIFFFSSSWFGLESSLLLLLCSNCSFS